MSSDEPYQETYKDHVIMVFSIQDSGGTWDLDVRVSREVGSYGCGSRYSHPETFESKDEALRYGIRWARKLIDGEG